ncbi:Valyl-tRNA synthetase [Halapricum desulfuricans]|uniref:Valine--tRNA ligase n=1 Tax=Halapricum desulfuricans TaxID=2841257 RepID=A0A897NH11_9EURY|nr:valine--tRNA ligase [Halapricum desulfuricans]QSG12002.1 Valyl-tRNA synthetase [Halapricum desulfuricans]
MSDLPDTYDPDDREQHWRQQWQEMDLYSYDAGAADPDTDYVIDTPPPYPTGNLHIGNALGWCYMDFAARYHRLQGEDVLFPQGWDCHGLPTEVKVEENEGIHRTDVPREEFRQMCIDHTNEQIDAMKDTMHTLGFSQDWDQEFRTMDPEYWGTTQESFVEMADDDLVYRDEHPVNWCPRCETAIADAEVETEEGVEGTLHYITFPSADGGDDVEIATTRPELLSSCVAMAVHPDDDRYTDRVGDTFEVPLFGQEVEIIADEEADPEFGTGAVMICTFGDKQDVTWWAEHDLDLRMSFTEDGHLNEKAGEYEGLTIEEAKEVIAEDLDEEGYLKDTEPTTQNVGQCWRCDTPIEILSKEQWFVEVDQDAILERGREVEWIPEHMYDRLEEWTEGMEWDWVISRQRVFATPIPAWFCANDECDHIHVADPEELPAKPTEEEPAIEECPECGATEWVGETDVMDTWMDSSITPLFVRDWPDEDFHPTTLRPQGHDIIRTWAFYTLLRTDALEDEIPWEEILINGMVFGDDGNKMSKSRGNFVQPEEVVEDHSADAFRQAMALAGKRGEDVQFQWKEVTSASRFNTKVWNITKFAAQHLDADREPLDNPAYRDIDRWILSRAAETAEDVAEHMDDYRFDAALRELREFVWHDLADDYLELIKGRLYEGRPGERDAARQGLFVALTASLKMLAPFAPFIAEEAYNALPSTEGSVHAAEWPEIDLHPEEVEDMDAVEQAGEIIVDVTSTIRGWKSDAGMALNAELDKVEVYPDDGPEERAIDTYDLSEAVNAPVLMREGVPSVELVPVEVDPDHSVIGPEFRDQAGQVVSALESMDPQEVKDQIDRHAEVEVDLGGEVAVVPGEAADVIEERRAASGEAVVVLESETATILIYE